MIKHLLLVSLSFALNGAVTTSVPPLWYNQPAQSWEEGLPIGNGRMAAMVFGGIEKERIQFNEESLWSGAPQTPDNPNALIALPKIRELLFDGQYQEAQMLTYANSVCTGLGECGGKGAKSDFGSYQTLGDLALNFGEQGKVRDYRRELDLNTATIRITYSIEDAHYSREYFVSAPDQILAVRLSCDKPGKISFTAELSREECASVRKESSDQLVLEGQLYAPKGIRFAAKLRALTKNGSCQVQNDALVVEKADSALLLLAAATNFLGKPHEQIVAEHLAAAARKSFLTLRDAHIRDHQSYFQRVELDFMAHEFDGRPTNERLQALQNGQNDPGLMAQYFHFGRYLLISSSRPGCLPANLQGKWAYLIQNPWNCDYHTNINLQMNYWAAEVANLADCHTPLFDFISTLQIPGSQTAKIHYGARGWVVHHITNLWGFTSPAENAKYGLFPCGGGWLCRHLWEHYAFNQDEAFLAKVYPLMRESAQFYLDILVEDPKTRSLVTAPSTSPENAFYGPDGKAHNICMGPSIDEQIIYDLFSHTIQAAQILKTDTPLIEQLQTAQSRLAPLQIGKHRQLQEWLEDFDEPEPGHRHISHLFALYPGEQISLTKTPSLAQAARKSLERRLEYGGGHTGWSQAWIINFWARLLDGEKAYKHLNELFSKSTFQNLLDNHPASRPNHKPLFQIDGNFGATAGIAEMLLQSHEGEIHLLPALPSAWPNGRCKGLKARGGVEVDIAWNYGQLINAQLRPTKSGEYKIRSSSGIETLHLEAGKVYDLAFP